MPEVSIIVPVYNCEKYIQKCIESILCQTFSDFEILAIDDGSLDKSGKILDSIAEKDLRLKVIHQENAGVSAARNRGIKAAKGEYLTFIDGDDYIGPDYIESFLMKAKISGADMIVCGVTFVREDGKCLKRIIPGSYCRFEKEEWLFRISAVWSHFYRRNLWERYDVEFENGVRGEDMPIALFFSAVCEKIDTLQNAEYYYVQHKASAMSNFKGLRKYRLPYEALENVIKKVQIVGLKNSREFYELFVLRILCTCIDLARGAEKEKKKELCCYIKHILSEYFPDYRHNKKAMLLTKLEIPFIQKVEVWVLVKLVTYRMLDFFVGLL